MGWVPLRSKPLSYHQKKLKKGYLFIENTDGKTMSLSPRQRISIGYLNRVANPLRFLRRAALARVAARLSPQAPQLSDGYVAFAAAPGCEAAIAVCERQLEIYLDFLERGDPALTERRISVAAYRAEMIKTADDPLKHVPVLYDPEAVAQLLAFGLQPLVVASVSRHLGVLPVLSGLRILYSPNAPGKLQNAQLFHIDPEGAHQTKVFMAVRKVGSENSPFTFLPRHVTRGLLESGGEVFQSNRVPDKFIEKRVPRKKWVEHKGNPGDALMVDTSQCFHFGSRPNAKPRVLLYYSFHDPFSSSTPVRYPAEKAAKAWSLFEGRPHPFTDYILSRKL